MTTNACKEVASIGIPVLVVSEFGVLLSTSFARPGAFDSQPKMVNWAPLGSSRTEELSCLILPGEEDPIAIGRGVSVSVGAIVGPGVSLFEWTTLHASAVVIGNVEVLNGVVMGRVLGDVVLGDSCFIGKTCDIIATEQQIRIPAGTHISGPGRIRSHRDLSTGVSGHCNLAWTLYTGPFGIRILEITGYYAELSSWLEDNRELARKRPGLYAQTRTNAFRRLVHFLESSD